MLYTLKGAVKNVSAYFLLEQSICDKGNSTVIPHFREIQLCCFFVFWDAVNSAGFGDWSAMAPTPSFFATKRKSDIPTSISRSKVLQSNIVVPSPEKLAFCVFWGSEWIILCLLFAQYVYSLKLHFSRTISKE